MTDARYLSRALTLLALACLLALWAYPEPRCRGCHADVLRGRVTRGGAR